VARACTPATAAFLRLNSAPVTAAPFTLACWFNPGDVTGLYAMYFLGDKDVATDYWIIFLRGDVAGDPLDFRATDSGGNNTAQTTTGYTAGTWHHACAVEASATSRAIYLNGGGKGTNTTSRAPANADRTSLGIRDNTSSALIGLLSIAEPAIWNVALTDAEAASLATGVSPRFVRPGNLVAHWPLVGRNDPETNRYGTGNLTLLNSPAVAAHPRLYSPPAPMIVRAPAAAPGGLSIPVASHSYRQRRVYA